MNKNQKYDASNIKVLTWKEVIRKRPTMYLAGTENCSYMVLNVIEYLIYANKDSSNESIESLSVIITEKNHVEVKVLGYGLPVSNSEGISSIENQMTKLHHNGYGLAVLNALSTFVDITIYSGGYKWRQSFKNAEASPLEKLEKSNKSKTAIRFLPNKKYFKNIYFASSVLKKRFEELSYLHPGLKLKFEDRSIRKAQFYNPDGLLDCLLKLLPDGGNWKTNVEPVQILNLNDGIQLQVYLVFARNCSRRLNFVNNEKTLKGGTPQKGVIAGIAQAFKKVSECKCSAAIWKPFIKQGLISIVSIKVAKPLWAGSVRDELLNKDIYQQIKSSVTKGFLDLINKNNTFAQKFKKLYVDDYFMEDFKKNHDEFGLPTAKYAKVKLKELFKNPQEYSYLIEQYKEYERLTEECLHTQK